VSSGGRVLDEGGVCVFCVSVAAAAAAAAAVCMQELRDDVLLCCAVVAWCRYSEDLLSSCEPMHLLWSGAHYDLLIPKVISRL
jgi:hypothetical protein